MKQLTAAALGYLQDYDETFPSDAGARVSGGSPVMDGDWGKDYWIFHFKPYVGGRVGNIQSPGASIFSCPSLADNLVALDDSWNGDYGMTTAFPENYCGLVPAARDENGCKTGEYCYYASYAINEHLTDLEFPTIEGPDLARWQAPAESFLFVEASKSEMEGDELNRSSDRYGANCGSSGNCAVNTWFGYRVLHQGGSNFAYIDGHVKWRKAAWDGAINGSNGRRSAFRFPPGSRDSANDCGPWTAPAGDNTRASADGGGPCN